MISKCDLKTVARHCAAALLGLAALAAAAQPAAPPPVEAFFATAKFGRAKLSPDGRWLATLNAQPGRRTGMTIIDLDGKDPTRFIEASPKEDAYSFYWVGNDWLVFTLVSSEQTGGNELGLGLMAVRRDGTQPRVLIEREWQDEDTFQRKRTLDPSHFFYSVGARGTTEVIVGKVQFRDRGGLRQQFSHIDLKILDVATVGARSMPGDLPRASSWNFDGNGQPRLASHTSEGITTRWYADKSGKWQELLKAPQYEQPFVPLMVDGDQLWVRRAVGPDGSLEVRAYDFTTGKPAAQALLATPGFDDVEAVIRDVRAGALMGVAVSTDAYTTLWFDPTMKDLQAKVDAKLHGKVNQIQCSVCSGPNARVLVHSYSDTDPGTYVLYSAQGERWQLLGQAREQIDPARMAQLDLHRIKARDGRDLPVWVTRHADPKGVKPRPGPAVVLVHGGPWVRGATWEFSSEAQFLASRGYTVIEPEFRGSWGYGESHFRAGWKQWGQKMQDDVTDALQFAIKQGWVDKSRVCIMGGSYGGYATLMGLVKDPDQYRCGVAFAALSDPRFRYDFYWSDADKELRGFTLPTLMGDRKADEAMLIANSPLEHASRIKVPVLLAHGRKDRRVPIENAERMHAALQRNGTPVEWVVYDEEYHGFFYDKNAFDFYRRVETFLAKHLK